MKSFVQTCEPTGFITRTTDSEHRPNAIAADMARVMLAIHRERDVVLESDLYAAGFVDYEIKLYRDAAAAEATRRRLVRETISALAA